MGEMEETNLKEKTSYTDILGKCTIKLQKTLSSDPIHHAPMEFFFFFLGKRKFHPLGPKHVLNSS